MLAITTIVQNVLTGHQLHSVLLHRYTNIHALATDPLGVLFSSLAPAERWLGQLRWLTVGLSSHIIATYVTRDCSTSRSKCGTPRSGRCGPRHGGQLFHGRRDGGARLPHRAAVAVGLYRGASAYFGFPLLLMDRIELSFTAVGHFAALLVGLAFYPLADERKAVGWSPATVRAAFRKRRRRDTSSRPQPNLQPGS